eukprot:g5879.t1
MRTKRKGRLGVLGVVAASVALGGFTAPASAGDGGRRGAARSAHPHQYTYYAGTLRVGAHRFVFRSNTSVRDGIASRFRQLGLDAWCSGDKVYVRFRGLRRPSIGWVSGSHQISTWSEGDCLVIRVIPPVRAHYQSGRHGRPVWSDGRWRGPGGAWIRGRAMARFGLILSGCGVFDGSEIQEAVACMHAIDTRGDTYACLAPDRELDTIDHRTQAPTGATRNVLVESARIARGEITSLSDVRGSDYDALVLPGGFGAAKNLCTFALDGPDCSVDEDVARVLREAHGAGRPIGFACIAPAVAAAVFGKELHPCLTIGTDAGTAAGLETLGAVHEDREPTGIVIDEANRIVSTPCYMSATRVSEVFDGCDKMVGAIRGMLA